MKQSGIDKLTSEGPCLDCRAHKFVYQSLRLSEACNIAWQLPMSNN